MLQSRRDRSAVHGYTISTDPADRPPGRVGVSAHQLLVAGHRVREVVDRAIDNSLPFVLLAPGGDLAGFGRVVTDRLASPGWPTCSCSPSTVAPDSACGSYETMLDHPDRAGPADPPRHRGRPRPLRALRLPRRRRSADHGASAARPALPLTASPAGPNELSSRHGSHLQRARAGLPGRAARLV